MSYYIPYHKKLITFDKKALKPLFLDKKVRSASIVVGRSRRPIRQARISGFCSMKRLGVFLLPLDGILVHRMLPPSILSGCPQSNLLVPIYTPGWKEALRELNVLPKNTTWEHRPGLKLSTLGSQVRRTNQLIHHVSPLPPPPIKKMT